MSNIQQDEARQAIATRTTDLRNAIARATQTTTNSFGSIVQTATTLRADVAASPYHDAADLAYLDGLIGSLAQTVQDTAAALLALIPSGS